MASEFGHQSGRAYIDRNGAFHTNGAAFFNGDKNDITPQLDVLDTLVAAELVFLDGAVAGTQTASKCVVADANVNTGVAKLTALHIGTSGSETEVTSTGTELNYLDLAALGTGAASKAVVLDSGDDFVWPAAGILTIANFATAAASAEHGAGAISTARAPVTRRWTERGVIIVQTTFDITGFLVKGDAADDALGITGGGDAYLGRYVVATDGVIFKVTLACLELPGEGTSTITQLLDIHTNSSSSIAYDGAVGANVLIDGASIVLGEVVENIKPIITPNEYYYLVEGDTVAATGEYNAGMFVLTTYGHPVLA